MSKILMTCGLLCAVAPHVAQADDVVEMQLQNPVTLMSGDNLYTFWKTNTSIHLNSTKEDFKPCTIAVDPVKDFTLTKLQAKELANHKFILWSFRSFDFHRSHKIVNINYTALIVDPSSCSYTAVSIPEEKNSWPSFHSQILPFIDGFDFFYPTHGKCSPCRFSLQGEPVPLEYQLEPEEKALLPYGFNILLVDKIDLSRGYIYTQNFKDGTAVIKYLDSHFKVLKQVLIEHPIHSLSVNYNKQPIISICYASHNFVDLIGNNTFKVYCEQLDSDLKSKYTVRMPIPEDHFVFGLTGITHRVDTFGNMFIGLMQFPQKVEASATRQLRFFASDKTGKLVEIRDYDKSNIKNEWFELRSHLSTDKKFCIVTDIIANVSNIDTHEIITCIDISTFLM